MQAKPAGVAKQPRMRQLPHREVERNRLCVLFEPVCESADAAGNQRAALATLSFEKWDPDIAARCDLAGELADDLAELGGEERPGHAAQHRGETPERVAELFWQLAADCVGERASDRLCDGLRESDPGVNSLLHPLNAGEGARRIRGRADFGRLVEPERGYGKRALCGGGVCSWGALRRDIDRDAPGYRPVDLVRRVLHRLLQRREESLERCGIARKPGCFRQCSGIDAAARGLA